MGSRETTWAFQPHLLLVTTFKLQGNIMIAFLLVHFSSFHYLTVLLFRFWRQFNIMEDFFFMWLNALTHHHDADMAADIVLITIDMTRGNFMGSQSSVVACFVYHMCSYELMVSPLLAPLVPIWRLTCTNSPLAPGTSKDVPATRTGRIRNANNIPGISYQVNQ